jgi:hypothetical protein
MRYHVGWALSSRVQRPRWWVQLRPLGRLLGGAAEFLAYMAANGSIASKRLSARVPCCSKAANLEMTRRANFGT